MLADFCFWVYKFETFRGVFLHHLAHLAALVQRILQNKKKSCFGTPYYPSIYGDGDDNDDGEDVGDDDSRMSQNRWCR